MHWLPKLDAMTPQNETKITEKLQQVIKPAKANSIQYDSNDYRIPDSTVLSMIYLVNAS